jgi:crossover junction endodeoxyribonuclease RusA
MTGVTFEVRDIPAPQGSKRHVGHGILVESSKKVKPWREAVRAECVAALIDTGEKTAMTGPVEVAIWFYLPRPKSHYRTGKMAAYLRDDAPAFCSKRPDVDKLIRSTLDALTAAGLYGDDGQVARLNVDKCYAVPAPVGAVITVRPL